MRLSFLSEAEISQLGQLIAKESEASGIFSISVPHVSVETAGEVLSQMNDKMFPHECPISN